MSFDARATARRSREIQPRPCGGARRDVDPSVP
jgi:hypothetical protein